jgi:hypothetical protein
MTTSFYYFLKIFFHKITNYATLHDLLATGGCSPQNTLEPLLHKLYHNAGCSPRDRNLVVNEATYMVESGMGPCFSRVGGET